MAPHTDARFSQTTLRFRAAAPRPRRAAIPASRPQLDTAV